MIKVESRDRGWERVSLGIKRTRDGREERVPAAQYRERNKLAITLKLKNAAPMRKGLVFLHIPKAAGTTLRHVISRHYPHELILSTDAPVTLSAEQRRRLRVIMGHVPFGTQTQLDAPVDVITMLRHPVERIASLYDYVRLRPGHPWHPLVDGTSLADFAACGHPATCNQQVRQLSGCDEVSRAALELATHHLTHELTVVGLAERFEESLVLLKRALGWHTIYHRRLNVTPGRPLRREIPRSTVARIESANELDLELYGLASRRFDDVVRTQDEGFHRALRDLRRFNRLYGALSHGVHAAAPLLPKRVRAVLTALRG